MAAIATIIITIAITAKTSRCWRRGPRKRAFFVLGSSLQQIWHVRRCCVIEKPAPGVWRCPDSLLASHLFSRRFLMRRSLTLAGLTVATLVASIAGAAAPQPMGCVQVGVLECRGGASVGFIVGSVTNLGCVLRIDGLPEDRYT